MSLQGTNSPPENRINALFQKCRSENRLAFMAYVPVGYPSVQESFEMCSLLFELGVDGIELGVPFSDPLLDGPTIQNATNQALQRGARVSDCFSQASLLRNRFSAPPLLIMSSFNPLLAFGLDRSIHELGRGGGDGFIIPDLPCEESQDLQSQCSAAGLRLVQFLAPTSTDNRLDLISQAAQGFIYLVSLTGVTGARSSLGNSALDIVPRIRARTKVPIVIGFGVSTPDHVRKLRGIVDGFIVGSAVVKAISNGREAVSDLIQSLRAAL